jgi:hypothetical protein
MARTFDRLMDNRRQPHWFLGENPSTARGVGSNHAAVNEHRCDLRGGLLDAPHWRPGLGTLCGPAWQQGRADVVVGLPCAITVSVFDGSAESIALWCKLIGRESLFYWYVTGCVFCSLLVYLFMREPQRQSRI